MNKKIMEMAISQVKSLVSHVDGQCEICHKSKAVFTAETVIDVIGIPTQIGIPTCRVCYDNIQIALGEISQEY